MLSLMEDPCYRVNSIGLQEQWGRSLELISKILHDMRAIISRN